MQELPKDLNIRENVPLAPMTTLKIGGAARFFVSAKNESEVIRSFYFAQENNFPLFILGGGSNVLIADQGFDGLVLQNALRGITFSPAKNGLVFVTAQAGEDWDELVALCVAKNLAGIECLSGIPGFVGGTPVQNVGAYGQEVSETIVSVRVFDRRTKEILELNTADCRFAYRASIFNSSDRKRFIVLSVTFALKPGGEPKIVYRDLREFFGTRTPTLQETREVVREIRSAKAMLVRQGGLDANSAGSFFKNPVISVEKYEKLCETAKGLGIEKIPQFPVDENFIKIPAAWLIEKSGFHKGYQKGQAGLSTRHTLALTNRGNATAAEILELKDEIQLKVAEKFDVELIPEPIFIGF